MKMMTINEESERKHYPIRVARGVTLT